MPSLNEGRIVRGQEARFATYLASVLPCHDPLPDWPALTQAGFGAIALHHVSLVAPERVLVFGSHVSSLLAHGCVHCPQ